MTYQTLFNALNHPIRLDILLLIRSRELCICELEQILNAKQYQISRHMKILKDLSLVHIRKQDKYHYYSLNNECQSLIDILEVLFAYPDDHIIKLKEAIGRLETNPIVCER